MTDEIKSPEEKPEPKKTRIKSLSPGDISVFCLQLSLILKSGIPVYEGLKILCDEEFKNNDKNLKINSRLAKVIEKLSADVELGDPLYFAMQKASAFPEYMVNMVEVGEMSGKLDSVLESLGDYYEREQYLKTKIRNSLMYPIFLFVIMSAVIFMLIVKVFPIFDDMLQSMGGSLSENTQNLTAFANSLATGRVAMIVILALAVIVAALALFSKTSVGVKLFHRITYIIPMTRNINEAVAASRFSSVISITISSGLDMNVALQTSVKMIENEVIRKKFEKCLENIENGMSFSKAVAETKVYKMMYVKFIEIGQKTGNLDTVMKKIADLCEGEADNAIGNATSFIEPLLIGVLSVVIGAILISVMLPLVQIMSSIA